MRQSISRSLERKDATIMRHRLCIHPISFSWRMAASTMGKPVRPSDQAANWDLSYDHEMLEYSGLKCKNKQKKTKNKNKKRKRERGPTAGRLVIHPQMSREGSDLP